MLLFHIRFEFYCFREVGSCAQVFICSRDIVTWVFPASGLFLFQGGQTLKNKQSVVEIKIV
jgi:hypothetical protein